VVGIRWMFH